MGAARAVLVLSLLVPGGGFARAAGIETVHRDIVRLAEEHGVRGAPTYSSRTAHSRPSEPSGIPTPAAPRR